MYDSGKSYIIQETTFTRTTFVLARYVVFVGFLCVSTLCQKLHRSFTITSPEFRRSVETEHLERGDSHNSALPRQ